MGILNIYIYWHCSLINKPLSDNLFAKLTEASSILVELKKYSLYFQASWLVGIKIARAHDASRSDNISVYIAPMRHQRERLWVVEDLKGRYRNGRNEWMNEYRSDDTGSWNAETAYRLRDCNLIICLTSHSEKLFSADGSKILSNRVDFKRWRNKVQDSNFIYRVLYIGLFRISHHLVTNLVTNKVVPIFPT